MSEAIKVGVVMGSNSDWDTMKHAVEIFQQFGVACEARVVSAHRMPDDMFAYAEAAVGRGLKAIVAGAGGAAHLPGMLAAKTVVPVLGVPVQSKALSGVDSAAQHRADACRACRSRPSPSAPPALPTRRCSRSPCWPTRTPRCAKPRPSAPLQTEAARAMILPPVGSA